jgi:hypothetical protein
LPCGSSSADGWREVTAPQQKQRASRHPAAEQLGDSEFSSRCFPFNAAARAFGSEAVVAIALRTTAPCCSESTAYPGPGCLPHGKAPQALDVMARNIFGGVEVGLRVCLHDWQGWFQNMTGGEPRSRCRTPQCEDSRAEPDQTASGLFH